MAKQWIADLSSKGYDGDKPTMSYAETGAAVGADQISLYIGDDVPVRRQNEIFNGWKWLFDGVKSRNLLDDQFNGAILYTASDVDIMTINDRRTSTELTPYTDTDVIIAIGSNITALNDTVTLDTAFKELRDFALENQFKFGFGDPQIVSNAPVIQQTNTAPPVFNLSGEWPGGFQIQTTLVITDPAGDVDNRVIVTTLPLPGPHSSATAASVIAAELDATPHIDCVAGNNSIVITATDPDYQVEALMQII